MNAFLHRVSLLLGLFVLLSSAGAWAQNSRIEGFIFEDPNYGGGAGRIRGTAGTQDVGTAGDASTAATVELYTSAGAYVATTTTSTTAGTLGRYRFNGIAAGSYIVRVVNSTVRSGRTGAVAGLLPVQTFRTVNAVADVSRVGGEKPEAQDAAAYTPGTTAVTLTLTGQNAIGDKTVHIDNITLNNGGTFANNSFETPSQGGGFSYNTGGASWTFSGGSGLAAVGSAFNVTTAPNGTQVAFVQNQGSFQQTTNLTAGTLYTLTLRAALRDQAGVPNPNLGQTVRGTVTMNGVTTTLTFTGGPVSGGDLAPTASTASTYATYTTTFTPTAPADVLSSFTAQSVAPVTRTGTLNVTGVNFGFNFSTVVNSNDSGQGSLRQFITNANTLTSSLSQVGQIAGREVSIFMIPDGLAHAGQVAGLVSGLTGAAGSARALIQTTSLLPTLADQRTVIDGTTQTTNIGDTNTGQVGTGGTVGVKAVTFTQINRPEIELSVPNSLTYALDLEGDSLGVRGMAVHGARIQAGLTTAARNLRVLSNLVGVTALTVEDPGGTAFNPGFGLYVLGASYGVVRGNLFGYAGNSGISASSSGLAQLEGTAPVRQIGLLITANEFVQNGYRQIGGDGISLGDAGSMSPVVITNNLITTSNSDGLQFDIAQVAVGGFGRNVVRNNTFFDNGNGSSSLVRAQLEGAGILYLQRSFSSSTGTNADSISFNVINQSQASGIVVGYGQRNIIISRNSTFGNGTDRNSTTGGNLGIDLNTNQNFHVGGAGLGATDYGNGDGVTPNNGTLTTGLGNRGMDYPVFTLSRFNSTSSITVAGYVGSAAGQATFAGATIEVFLANNLDNTVNNGNNGQIIEGDGLNLPHGEGETYLGTLTADASGNFTGDLTAPTGVVFSTTGQSLTATAYLSGSGTSEFANNSPLTSIIVSGYIFEDANYGGGAGRSRATLGADAVGRPGVTVEIYNNANAVVGSTTTDATGQYSFNVAAGNYIVRVVSSTVTSARLNGTTASPAPVPVQTYANGDVNRVGGEDPAVTADAGAGSSASVTLTFTGLNPSGLDNSAFVDNIQLITGNGILSPNPIGNPSFETPSVGTGFQYSPSGATWTYPTPSGPNLAGIAGNGSTFNPATAFGSQVGLLQSPQGNPPGFSVSSFTQTFLLPAGSYAVQFANAQRVLAGRINNETIQVSITIGGVTTVIGTVTPTSGTFTTFTTSAFGVTGVGTPSAANSRTSITVGTTSITDVDFGYNFSTITNTNDTGHGSLRQFIANSNALGGESSMAQAYTNGSGVTTALTASKETSIFMVPGSAAVPGLRSGLTNGLSGSGVAVFTPNTATNGALIITGSNTVIDGTTQSRNSNGNNVTLGTGGMALNGVEVQIVGTPGATASDFGLTLSGTNNEVRGISIYGFGNSGAGSTGNPNGANIYVTGGAGSGTVIAGNMIGTAATTFPTNGVDPNTVSTRSTGHGVLLANLTSSTVTATVSNNLIGYNGQSGVQNMASGVTGGVVISGNEIRNNGILNSSADGVRMGNAGGTVQANLITANRGSGVDFDASTGSILVTGNTITGNGTGGAETSGIRAYGLNNTVSLNTISGNTGNGVLVRPGTNTANVSGLTTITQNSITGNTQRGIDLLANGQSETGYAVTVNDMGDTDGRSNGSSAIGGNGLINFPVILQARINGSNLVMRGYARPGATIELFLVGGAGTADPTSFGEGATYLLSAVEGSGSDTNNTTNTYSGSVNGISQGTDNTNMFDFSIPLASLPGVAANSILSSTATLASVGTSEFSGVVTVGNGPLPVELVSFTAQVVKNVDAQLNWRTASEKNNDHFDVERSFNGTEFVKIGHVQGKGTTTSVTDYTLTDAGIGALARGQVYYRLRQVDTDGETAFSPVRSLSFAPLAGESAIGLVPNPAAAGTSLDLTQLPSGTYQVSLLDATGRVVRGLSLSAGQAHLLDLRPLASGTYTVLVRGQHAGRVVHVAKRLVKE